MKVSDSKFVIPPRIELFSDAVFAILITIMVLELHPPVGHSFSDLLPLWPVFLSYALSFAYLLIYWNNHHHLLLAMKHLSWKIMWANALLLFCLSLIPFATAWVGESGGSVAPATLYGFVLLVDSLAYFILQSFIIAQHSQDSLAIKNFTSDRKGKLSVLLYTLAVVIAFISPLLAYALYAIVAVMWIIPRHVISK